MDNLNRRESCSTLVFMPLALAPPTMGVSLHVTALRLLRNRVCADLTRTVVLLMEHLLA